MVTGCRRLLILDPPWAVCTCTCSSLPHVNVREAPRVTLLFGFCRKLWEDPLEKWAKIFFDHLPRSMRTTITDDERQDHSIIERLVELSTPRALTLLKNVDELQRDVISISLSHGTGGGPLPVRGNTGRLYDNLSDEESQRTLNLARRAHRNARPGSHYWGSSSNPAYRFHNICEEKDSSNALLNWRSYKGSCRHRHAWGQFFRSNLDWDWNLASSLKRMYKLPRKREGLLTDSSLNSCYLEANACQPAQPTASLTNGILEAAFDMPEQPVEEVRVAYRSPTGESLYKTFRVVAVETPASDRSRAGYTESESEPRVAINYTEAQIEGMRVYLGPSESIYTVNECKETSVEDGQRLSDVSRADRQDCALEGQVSGKVKSAADDQVSLYSFL